MWGQQGVSEDKNFTGGNKVDPIQYKKPSGICKLERCVWLVQEHAYVFV